MPRLANLFLELNTFYVVVTRRRFKKADGRGDHTRVFIADTRRCAQFSLGRGNLIRRAGMTSDF
jgi:hypothetical protein